MNQFKLFFTFLALFMALMIYLVVFLREKPVSFVAIGDMPYSDQENAMLSSPEGSIYRAIRKIAPPVLVHLGDLKGGGEACTDELLISRRDQMAALNPGRVVYTPGDNDWTDCDYDDLTPRFDELERKDFLLKIFFQEKEGQELYQKVAGIRRQKEAVENAAWKIGGLQFITIHLVGTNNGRSDITMTPDPQKALDDADLRDQNNAAWLKYIFQNADDAKGIVIAFQEDIYRPNPHYPGIDCTPQNRDKCDGLKATRELIEKLAQEYKQPVLALHGSTNAYCLHRPDGEKIPNLWRFNAFGDFKYSDAALVTFDSGVEAPFRVEGLLENREIPEICDYSR